MYIFFFTIMPADEIAFNIDFFILFLPKILTASTPIKVSLAPVTSNVFIFLILNFLFFYLN